MGLADYKNKVRSGVKLVYHTIAKRNFEKKIMFIFGSQRSGTTMLNEIFDRDLRTKTYSEDGGLARGWGRGTPFRLKPLDEVKRIFLAEKAALLIAKPLVEGQHARKILDYFEGSKAIWVYRHFQDVVNSNIKKFGATPIKYNIEAVINPDLKDHWFAENVSDRTMNVIKSHYNENRSMEDLGALAWYVRNILFFEQNLEEDPRVFLCKYEDLVTKPREVMKKIYDFAEIDFRGDSIIKIVHPRSKDKGKDILISEDIMFLCNELLIALDDVVRRNEPC